MAVPVKGFGCRPLMAVPRRYGDSTAVALERERNLPLWHEHCEGGKTAFSARAISKSYML
jgi:hypothetical protein